MKTTLKIVVILGILFALSAGCYCVANTASLFEKPFKGSGDIITRTIDAPKYDGIKASRAVRVIITDKQTDKITIEADDNLMEFVEVSTHDGKLRVSISNEIKNLSNASVKVIVPANGQIRSLDANSAANIVSEVTLNGDKFEIGASSAAKIEASVAARECEVDASSAAKIIVNIAATDCSLDASSASKIDAVVKATTYEADASSAAKIMVAGSAQRATVDISSASSFKAPEFVVADYNIRASSGSSADINCSRKLHASASSGSSIHYSGDCNEVTRNMSSGGSVRKN